MRKTLLAAALGLAMTSALPALDLAVHSGYTSFSLSELNRSNAWLVGYEANPYAGAVKSGVVVGADLTVPFNAWLKAGLRTEMMQSNRAETKSNVHGTAGVQSPPDTCFTDQAGLSTLLVGGSSDFPTDIKGLDLGLGAWVGVGYATLQQHVTLNTSSRPYEDGLYMGSLPVAEVESSVSYGLGQHIRLNFTGGWRWADAPALYDDTHQPFYGNGAYWINNGSSGLGAANLDYGGVTAQGSVSYGF
jgi:hypothetical protein